jgi:hypothetical protein
LLQGYIFQDSLSDVSKSSFEFELDTFLLPEFGGCPIDVNESLLNQEICNDIELREKILREEVPTVDTIFKFDYHITIIPKINSKTNIVFF